MLGIDENGTTKLLLGCLVPCRRGVLRAAVHNTRSKDAQHSAALHCWGSALGVVVRNPETTEGTSASPYLLIISKRDPEK